MSFGVAFGVVVVIVIVVVVVVVVVKVHLIYLFKVMEVVMEVVLMMMDDDGYSEGNGDDSVCLHKRNLHLQEGWRCTQKAL